MTDNRTTELTATDRLRVMLDERGVEWTQGMAWNVTVINGDWLVVEDIDFGTLSVSTTAYQLTPEQAIAATLGEKPRDKTEEWLLKACNQATQDYVTQLEQEVDELKQLVRDTFAYIDNCCESDLSFGCVDPVDCAYYDKARGWCTKASSLKQRMKALGFGVD